MGSPGTSTVSATVATAAAVELVTGGGARCTLDRLADPVLGRGAHSVVTGGSLSRADDLPLARGRRG